MTRVSLHFVLWGAVAGLYADQITMKNGDRVTGSIVKKDKDSLIIKTTGAYRQNFDAGLTAQLTKWLIWNAAASDRYLSRPVPGRKNNDFLYTMGFGFSFTR